MSTTLVVALGVLGVLGLLGLALLWRIHTSPDGKLLTPRGRWIRARVHTLTRLARPSWPARWSRGKLLRGLQIGGMALAGVLALGVTVTSQRIDIVRSGTAALAELPNAPDVDAPCIGDSAVADALKRTAALDADLRGAWLPWSLWTDASDQALVKRVSERVLAQTLLPALACRLNERMAQVGRVSVEPSAPSYSATRVAALARAEQVAMLHAQLEDFARVTGNQVDAAHRLAALNRLVPGLVAVPPPRATTGSLLGRALALMAYPEAAKRISASGEAPSHYVTDALAPLPGQLQQALLAELNAGPTLLATIEKRRDTLRADSLAFVAWLDRVATEWLPLDATRNPCTRLGAELGALFGKLQLPQAEQSRLSDELKALSASESCYSPARAALIQMQLAPQKPLVSGGGEGATLNPAWDAERRGLKQVSGERFMDAHGAQAFVCVRGASTWQRAEIDAAVGHANDYKQWARANVPLGLGAPGDERPMFDQVARHLLERAMNGSMIAAQTSPAAVAPVEQGIRQASITFAQALAGLMAVQQAYRQLRFDASAAALTRCVRNFALDSLRRVTALARSNRLYALGPGSGSQLLDGGSTATMRDFLAMQRARASVLVDYARPFLALLDNGASVGDSQATADKTQSYWANTTRELMRHSHQMDASGQVGQIETLLLETFAELTADNCAARLAAYKAADDANDLFAERRRALTTQVRRSCAANAETN